MTWWKRLLVMVLAAVLLISAVWWGSGRIIPAMRRLSVSQEALSGADVPRRPLQS